MKSTSELGQWLELAKEDLSAARFLTKMHPMPMEIVCFHCQQSGEKYLKAILCLKGLKIPKVHDLFVIYDLVLPFSPQLETLFPACQVINEYGIGPRYPYNRELIESDVTSAVAAAGQIEMVVLGLFFPDQVD